MHIQKKIDLMIKSVKTKTESYMYPARSKKSVKQLSIYDTKNVATLHKPLQHRQGSNPRLKKLII